ncbi:hypothetical protein [Streptosporangium sp. CA-115845]|uniref:hypothetical protein n=1 Tax=Streptosporangium sp. CA-115845 TaxID=3240071 RepID=UPI003D8DA56C
MDHVLESPQDDGSLRRARSENGADQIAEADWVDGLARRAQLIKGPPAAGLDGAGLDSAIRVNVVNRDPCEIVPLNLADFLAANLLLLAAFSDLPTQWDFALLDAGFLSKFGVKKR